MTNRTRERGQRGFAKLCRELGIRAQDCLIVTSYENGSVTAVYKDPGSPSIYRGRRVVHWLRAPASRLRFSS